ncbi:MAG: hydrogenase maturation protease [Actinomycetota bacterium]
MARVRVIGCGNPDAGDDAAGLLAVAALRGRVPDGVEVVFAGPAVRVLDLLDGVDLAIVIDAVRSPSGGRAVGTLVRAEAGPDGLPAELRGSLSSHGLGVAEAVGLAAALGAAPRVVFHGVEAGDVTAGAPPSASVLAALAGLEAAVLGDVTAPAR